MTVSVRLTVRKDRPYTKTPHFSTPKVDGPGGEEYYCTTGVDADMRTATRAAVRNMIEFLCAEHGFERVDAYMLCSVAADLRLHEVVSLALIGALMIINAKFGRRSTCRITS